MANGTKGKGMNVAMKFGRMVGLAGALLVSVATVTPAFAAGTVTQVINCGGNGNSLSANIADLNLTAATFSTSQQDSQGILALVAGEAGCAAKGWNVTVQASDWAKQEGGAGIPASNFALTQVTNPTVKSGQGIDNHGGPRAVNETGTLNQSRKVLQANPGYGLGTYEQNLNVKLTIPAYTLPGTYKTTVTTTITAAP